MFYEAVAQDGSRSIGLGVSKDGRSNWQRLDAPVLSPAPDSAAWDSGSVGAPCAVSMSEGRWRLYYSGHCAGGNCCDNWQGIGLALSAEVAQFEGITVPVRFKRRAAAGGQ